MGMDVYGKQPDAEVGKYFHNSVWRWRPLADYCCEVAPEITSACKYWQSNDRDGLDEFTSKELAAVLRSEINSGQTKAYEDRYRERINALPDETCNLCNGTGVRTDEIGVKNGMTERDNPHTGKKGWCNGCNGKGKTRPIRASYPFLVENVQAFVEFLEHCGGFEIC